MTAFESLPLKRERDWVEVHARARRQRARLMRVLARLAWRNLRRRLRRAAPTPAVRPAYEYWT